MQLNRLQCLELVHIKDGDEITYCNTGHWASVAWFGLSEVMGNKNTAMYDGSMTEWAADPNREMVVSE